MQVQYDGPLASKVMDCIDTGWHSVKFLMYFKGCQLSFILAYAHLQPNLLDFGFFCLKASASKKEGYHTMGRIDGLKPLLPTFKGDVPKNTQ